MNQKYVLSVLTLALASTVSLDVQAETVPGTNLSVNFQSAHIVGAGRNINVLRVPVTDLTTGQTTHFDASFRFTFRPNEGFLFETMSAALSAPVSTNNIRSGLYQETLGSRCYRVDGPSLISDGRSFFSIRGLTSSISGCGGSSFSSQFVTGPAVGHPDIGLRDIAPNLNESWAYGVVGGTMTGSPGSTTFNNWPANGLVGIRQNGDQLTISLFDLNGGDTIEPQQSSILTRIGE